MERSTATRGRWTPLGVAAVAVPAVAHAASLLVNVEAGAWTSMPASVRWALVPDALLYSTAAAVVLAPIAGVTVGATVRASGGNAPDRAVRPVAGLVGAVLLFAACSAALTLAWTIGRADAFTFAARTHLALGAAALVLGGWGALCGAVARDPLDGVALSLGVTSFATVGLLLGGPLVADLPRPVITAGLAASPLVAVASAAHIDVVRMDLLYQISPLAHLQVDYPAWHRVAALHLAVAAGCYGLVTWGPRSLRQREQVTRVYAELTR